MWVSRFIYWDWHQCFNSIIFYHLEKKISQAEDKQGHTGQNNSLFPPHYSTLKMLFNILTPTPVCNSVFSQCPSALSSGFTFSLLKHHNSLPYQNLTLLPYVPWTLLHFIKPFISFSSHVLFMLPFLVLKISSAPSCSFFQMNPS